VTDGRPPKDDDQLVSEIVAKLGRNVRLSTTLAKLGKADKSRVRRKVRKRVETISKLLEQVKD
jgi:hypothetical protein